MNDLTAALTEVLREDDPSGMFRLLTGTPIHSRYRLSEAFAGDLAAVILPAFMGSDAMRDWLAERLTNTALRFDMHPDDWAYAILAEWSQRMTEPTVKARERLLDDWASDGERVQLEPMVAAIEAEAVAAEHKRAVDACARVVMAERARIAEAVRALDGECHDGEGLGCETHPCVENVSRASVLAIVKVPDDRPR